MYDYLQRSDAAWQKKNGSAKTAGGAGEKQNAELQLEDYEPAEREKKGNKKFVQKMCLGNSFGSLRLGMNEDGETIFLISGKKGMKETPLPFDAKRHESSRAAEKAEGVFAAGVKAGVSAAAYRDGIKQRWQQEMMLERLREMLAAEKSGFDDGNNIVQAQLPFLFVEQDKERLRQLNEADTRQSSRQKQVISRQKSELKREIQLKQELKREVMAEITAAVQEPVRKKDDGIMPWSMKTPSFIPDSGDPQDDGGDNGKDKDVQSSSDGEKKKKEI